MTSTLLAQEPARGGVRLVFQHQDGEHIHGPFVEQRPGGDDVEAFLAAHAAALAESLVPVPKPTILEQVVQNIRDVGAGTDMETLRAQLGLTDAQVALILGEGA